MSTSITRRKHILVSLLSLVLVVVFFANTTAADTFTLSVTFTYDQGTARAMLDPLNQWRTGKTWYWNSDNSTKTNIAAGQLSTLQWDYDLEEIAKIRAAELIALFDHMRPDGSDIYTIIVNGTQSKGENISFGSGSGMLDTYMLALEGFQEENEDYSGQGHRRNMLNPRFNAVGIAHVEYNGGHYWVQEFGFAKSDATDHGVDNSTCTTDLTVEMDLMEIKSYVTGRDSYGQYYQANYGAVNTCPKVIAYWGLKGAMQEKIVTWTHNNGDTYVEVIGFWFGNPLEGEYEVSWASSNESIAKIVDGNKYQIVGIGDCTLTATVNYQGMTCKCSMRLEGLPVNVTSDSNLTISAPSVTYTGSALTPDLDVQYKGIPLTAGTDYNVVFSNNTNVGTATAQLTFAGKFKGSKTFKFAIDQKDIGDSDVTVEGISDQIYTGTAIRPDYSVHYGDMVLTTNDYSASFSSNTDIGTAKLVLQGKGNYTGYKYVYFDIYDPAAPTTPAAATTTPASETTPPASETTQPASDTTPPAGDTTEPAAVTTTPASATTLPASETTPPASDTTPPAGDTTEPAAVTTTPAAATTTPASDTTPPASDTTPPASDTTPAASDTTPPAGDTTEPASGTTEPAAATTSPASATTEPPTVYTLSIDSIPDQQYNGSAIEPAVTVRADGTAISSDDYSVIFSNNVNAGTASVFVTGKGIYSTAEPVSATFKIDGIQMSSCTITDPSNQTYSGAAKTPAVTVKYGSTTLTADSDYTIAYSNNVNAGTATVTITGKGNYSGIVTKQFTIGKLAVSMKISSISNVVYTGTPATPVIVVTANNKTLESGTDYSVLYSNNNAVGTGKVTVTACGNYQGTATATFQIVKGACSWKKISGKWYYVDKYGNKTYGAEWIGGKLYYFDKSTGAMLTGWKLIDNQYHYMYSGGNSAIGWVKVSGKWYYFDKSDGHMYEGLYKIDGKWYFFKTGHNGQMFTGWKMVDGVYYYFTSNGAKTGWQKISKVWYYFDPSTAKMVTGWKTISGKTYYFLSSGKMATGWQKISGSYYYFNGSGVRLTNSWVKSSGKWYYMGSNGVMLANTSQTISGKVYRFNASGVCTNP